MAKNLGLWGKERKRQRTGVLVADLGHVVGVHADGVEAHVAGTGSEESLSVDAAVATAVASVALIIFYFFGVGVN